MMILGRCPADGLAAEENVADDVDVQLGTLSKALGTAGGYICGSRNVIDWLINRARSFIYSTAPPPAIAAAALAAVNFLSSAEGEQRRRRLWRRINLMQQLVLALRAGHLSSDKQPSMANAERSTPNKASSAIFPLIVGSEERALDLASALQNGGFFVPAIRYPTVAKGAARLRITVTAAHEQDHVRELCAAIARDAASA